MTITSAEKFGQLLTEGVHRIRIIEGKKIQLVQDELGYALGRPGGSVIEYWRKGHIPQQWSDLEILACEIVKRGKLDRKWLQQFLYSAGYAQITTLGDILFATGPNQSPLSFNVTSHESREDVAVPGDEPAENIEFASFVTGPPITNPSRFFGRNYEIKRIFELWKRLPLQNVAIIGPKRSGKTSLLHYLQNITTMPASQLRPGQRADWLPQPERYNWVFVDFQDARMCHPERLFRYILTTLKLPVPESCDLPNFIDTLSEHLHTPTLILLDEIGVALSSPALDQQFWWSLRSLGSNLTGGNLGFALAAHQSPVQLAEEQHKPSPFFNIFGHSFRLGPLSEPEAYELINSTPYQFDRADVEWIMTESGLWPCLLQILCHTRLVTLGDNQHQTNWREEGLHQMIPFRALVGKK